jgi:hypothetical protein
MSNRLLELVTGHGALLERSHHAVAQFVLVEWLARVIVFDQPRHYELCRLEGCEPFVAVKTLPAPTNLPAITREAGVYDLGFFVGAERTMHD